MGVVKDSNEENVYILLELVKQTLTMIVKQVLKFKKPAMITLVPNLVNGPTGLNAQNLVAEEPVERSGNANCQRLGAVLKAVLGNQKLKKFVIHRCVLFGLNGLIGPRVVPLVVAGNRRETENVYFQNLEPSNVQEKVRKNENATATSVQIGPPGQSGVPVQKLVVAERELSLESVSYYQEGCSVPEKAR